MPTPAERRALLFVATVATLGVAVRGCAALSREPPPISDRESLARQLEAVDSAIATGGLVLTAWVAAAAVIGGVRFTRRDV